MLVAELVIGTPLTSSMTKYGRPAAVVARIEHLGDVRVVHQRQRFALCLEPRDDLTGVHAGLDQLQGDAPMWRCVLFEASRWAEASPFLRNQAREPDGADEKGRMRIAGHCGLGWLVLAGRRRGRLVKDGLPALLTDVAGSVVLQRATAAGAIISSGLHEARVYPPRD